MFETTNELLKRVRSREDKSLELKEVRIVRGNIMEPKKDALADDFAAFANSSGGVILLGVNNKTRKVTGIPIENLNKVEELVIQASVESINPSVFSTIERVNLQDDFGNEKPVMCVEIPLSHVVHQSPGGYFHRVGSSKQNISTDQLGRLFEQRSRSSDLRFEKTTVFNATIDDLNEILCQRFVTPRTIDKTEHFLSKLGMASQDNNGIWRPTVAGILIASKQPQQFIPNAYIQAVAYRGNEISAATAGIHRLDAQEITGSLDQQIYGACDFIRKNMRVEAKKDSGGRQDIPQYSELAVFEAVTNSVAHRDYSMVGCKIRLRIFNDRLELYTPGSLVNTMTPESLSHSKAIRNEVISSQLARCPIEKEYSGNHRSHIMDKRGEGVPIILKKSKELSGKSPEYKMIDQSELLLTIYAADCS